METKAPIKNQQELDIIQYCKWLNKTKKLTILDKASFNPDIVIKYERLDYIQYVCFVIFYKKQIVGFIEFEQPIKLIPKSVEYENTLLTPHCQIVEQFRNKGYCFFFYNLMLNKGFSLITNKHTSQASSLWENVARNRKATIYHYNIKSQQLQERQDNNTVKIMSDKPYKKILRMFSKTPRRNNYV